MVEDSGVIMPNEEEMHKNVDEFVVKLTMWADEDLDAILDLMERMTGKQYVGRKEQKAVCQFLATHIDLLAAVVLSLNKQCELVQALHENIHLLRRTNAANETIIREMKKFLPPDIRDGLDKIK